MNESTQKHLNSSLDPAHLLRTFFFSSWISSYIIYFTVLPGFAICYLWNIDYPNANPNP